MRAFLRNMDPESFRGKVWLLVIDKVFIGAFIGFAVIGYYIWTSRDIRTYEENREEIQLSFKRAEYIKELVPIVLNADKDILFRAQSLGALLETESIEASSAVYFANRLLLSDVDAELIREGRFLKAKLLLMMPTGLPEIINQYRTNQNAFDNEPNTNLQFSAQRRVQWFWSAFLQDVIRQNRDRDISILNSDNFLDNNLRIVIAMLPSLDAAEAQQWAARNVKGIRIFGNLEVLRPVVNHPTDGASLPSEPITFLSSIVDPSNPNLDQLGLATELLRVLSERGIASREISLRLLTALARPDVREAVQRHSPLEGFNEHVHKVADWSYRVLDYLEWSAKSRRDVAEGIETPVFEAVNAFHGQLRAQHTDALDQRANLIERRLVDVLMNTTLASNRSTTERSRELLSQLFSIEEEDLRKAGIWGKARDWKTGEWRTEAEYE